MTLRIVRAIAASENLDEFHLGRILLLLQAADSRSTRSMEGLMKLAKLDFLLRYPNCLERALVAANQDPKLAEVKSHERTTIEAKMIRFRYGPWDSRYRRWIGLLVARDLAMAHIQGKAVRISLTDKGRETANILATQSEFIDLAYRSNLIMQLFGTYAATRLKDFIYEVFPELVSMKWGEEIAL